MSSNNGYIYLVIGVRGEDNNYETWPIAAYYDENQAKQHSHEANKTAKKIDEKLHDLDNHLNNYTVNEYVKEKIKIEHTLNPYDINDRYVYETIFMVSKIPIFTWAANAPNRIRDKERWEYYGDE